MISSEIVESLRPRDKVREAQHCQRRRGENAGQRVCIVRKLSGMLCSPAVAACSSSAGQLRRPKRWALHSRKKSATDGCRESCGSAPLTTLLGLPSQAQQQLGQSGAPRERIVLVLSADRGCGNARRRRGWPLATVLAV